MPDTLPETHCALPRMMDSGQVADWLLIKEQTLAAWRVDGRGPRFIKVGRTVRYRAEDVLSWLQARTVGNTKAITDAGARLAAGI